MKNILAVVLCSLVVLAILKPEISMAYTIALSCDENVLPPPGRPYQNVDCNFSWSVGGDTLARFGRDSTYLYFADPFGTRVLTDKIETGWYSLVSTAPPVHTYIGCSNTQGGHELHVSGYLAKLVFPNGMSGPGYYQQQDWKSDWAWTYISTTYPC